MILGQAIARSTNLPGWFEAVTIIAVVTIVLLVTYRWGVRYTPIGTMLNGRRTKTEHRETNHRPRDGLS